jgi:DNA-binding SARP family transcriptional activator
LNVAERYLKQGDYQATLEYCYRLLKDDNCLEEAYRLSMKANAQMGNQAQVIRQFELCCKALQKGVNAPPSVQTEQLYKSLTSRPS